MRNNIRIDEPVRLAVLGAAGPVGPRYLEAARSVPGLEVVALVDLNIESAAAYGRALAPEAATFRTQESLLASGLDVDASIICTPSPLHEPMAIMELRAGRVPAVDKPFATNALQAGAVYDVARAVGLPVFPLGQRRFVTAPAVQQLIPELVGEPRLIEWQWHRAGDPPPFARRLPQGIMSDLVVHGLFSVLPLLQDRAPLSLTAVTEPHPDWSGEVGAHVRIVCEGDVMVTLDARWMAHPAGLSADAVRLKVLGTEGELNGTEPTWEDDDHGHRMVVTRWEEGGPDGPVEAGGYTPISVAAAHVLQLRELEQVLRGLRAPGLTEDEVMTAMAIVDAAYYSGGARGRADPPARP